MGAARRISRGARRAAVPLVAALLVLGCAPAGAPRPAAKTPGAASAAEAPHGQLPIWRLDELVQAPDPVIALRSPAGIAAYLPTARVRRIAAVAAKVAAAAGPGELPDWLLVGTPAVNAFASYQNGRPVIGITLGMHNLLKDDDDAWGALIGHELAHFRLGHHQAQKSRKTAVAVGSSLAGLALSIAGFGIGNLAADTGGKLVERAFSRDDERDADRAGLDYVKRAGLDPRGALRLQQRLMASREDASFGFLSTHPTGSDRIEALQRLLEEPAPAK